MKRPVLGGALIKFCVARIVILAAVILSPAAATAQGQDDAFRKDILKLLDLTGSAKMGLQMASLVSGQILDGLKQGNPDVPPRAIEVAKELLNQEFAKAFESPEGLTPQIVTLYAK